jgi:hypothetical protein
MARKAKVPRELAPLIKLAERDDLTPAEQWRGLLAALLLVADRLDAIECQAADANATASKALDVVLKQHAALLLDRTDPGGG